MQWATKHWRRFSALLIFSVLLISALLISPLLLLISPLLLLLLLLLLHLIICGLCLARAWAPVPSAGMCCSGTPRSACQGNKLPSFGMWIQPQVQRNGTAGPAQMFGVIGRTLACHGSSTQLGEWRQYAAGPLGEQRLCVPGINEEATGPGSSLLACLN